MKNEIKLSFSFFESEICILILCKQNNIIILFHLFFLVSSNLPEEINKLKQNFQTLQEREQKSQLENAVLQGREQEFQQDIAVLQEREEKIPRSFSNFCL